LELACRETAADRRISLHDPARRSLVSCLEDHDAGVDLAQGGADEDKRAFSKEVLEKSEIGLPDGLFRLFALKWGV
jgi:hypothetical protein